MKFGQYELLERIAIGGMAEVYRGRVVGAEGFEKLVAIKRIQPDLIADERFVTMLLTEARIHSALSHRNIVQIHDLGISEEGEYFIVLEYVEGYDLRAIMESITGDGEIIPEALSLHIAAEVAQGLHFAHELRGPDRQPLGLIHRDVSPSNVLISFAGEVKLSDFGLAKRRHDRSVVGSLKGNLIYMSPEQARQAPLDRRTDVFSLGALLFELLTGKRLREITDEIKGWGEVAAGVVRSARSARSDLPPAFEALLNQALAAEPARRFPDAGTFGAAIRQLLAQMNTPVGPSDLQALLGLVRPPKRPRGELERSKVIRLAPEPGRSRLGPPLPASRVGRAADPFIDRLRSAQAQVSPASPLRRPAPTALGLGPAGKLPDDIDSYPPTPPPATGPAAPAPQPQQPKAGSPHHTWAGGFSLTSEATGARLRPAPMASALVAPAPPPPAVAPPGGGLPAGGLPEGRHPTMSAAAAAAAAMPTPPAGTPAGPVSPRVRTLVDPSAFPVSPRVRTLVDPGSPPAPPAPRTRTLVDPDAPRPGSSGSELSGPSTPLPAPAPAMQFQDWSSRPTPPPTSPLPPPIPSSDPAVPSPRDGVPSAPTWQPAQSARHLQPLDDSGSMPHTSSGRMPVLPIGFGRSVAVGVAALLVTVAFIVHVGFIPLEVLASWKKPAQLYVASEPEGGIAKLDGVRLIDPTPTKMPVARDRLDHVLEVEYPGYRLARQTVRFDRSVALSFLVTLEREGDADIVPVSERAPAAMAPQAADGDPATGR